VQTLFGPVVLKRRYYYHVKAKRGRYPLDETLDLVRGHSPILARLICRAASQSASYEDAAQDLLHYAGLHLHGRNFSRLVAEIVPQLHQAQASISRPTQADAPHILYALSDGTGIPLRRSELKDVKGKQPDGSAKTREAKLGCIFTQTTTDAEGHPIRDHESTTYVSTFADCRTLGTLLRAEALRRGYAQAQQTVYIGDGAPWIWENARINFPDAVQILDFYHASEHVGQLATHLLGPGPAAKARHHQWNEQMKASSTRPIIEQATTELSLKRDQMQEEQIKAIEGEISYLQTNAQRSRYAEFIGAGYFIGSGVVEAGCKTVVGRRLKQSGMFWSHQGGEDLLSLRCLTLGPTFPEVWKARLPILAQQRAKPPKWSKEAA
jgi:hypothetical protein